MNTARKIQRWLGWLFMLIIVTIFLMTFAG
jgi:hypothetical protein